MAQAINILAEKDDKKRSAAHSPDSDQSIDETILSRRPYNRKNRSNTFSNIALDPYVGKLRCRLDTNLNHLPIKCMKDANCQLHYWLHKSKFRQQLMTCPTCNVNLCIYCYKIFHDVPNLKYLEDKLKPS